MTKENPFAKEYDANQRRPSDIRDLKLKDNSEHHIRILPHMDYKKDASKYPFHGYINHWVEQRNAAFSRSIVHALKGRCLLCGYVAKLYNEINRLKEEEGLTDENPKIKEIYKHIVKSKPHKKYDFNVLDRDDLVGSDKQISPKRFSATPTIWRPIFDYAKNPKWGDPSDENDGYDIIINVKGRGEFREYQVLTERDASPLTKEEKEAIQKVYDLEALRKPSTEEEIIEIISNARDKDITTVLNSDDETEASHSQESGKAHGKSNRFSEEEEEVSVEDESTESTPSKAKSAPAPEQSAPAPQPPKRQPPKTGDDTDELEASEIDVQPAAKSQAAADDANPDNINDYQCKGKFETEDEGCRDCKVQAVCQEFQPAYEKAVELGIDVSTTVEEITKAVNSKKEEKKPEKKVGKKIPF